MKKITVAVLLFLILALGGCGKSVIYDEPEDFKQLEICDYVSPENPDDGYRGVFYNDRLYLPFGTQGKTIKEEMIKSCIGYTGDDTNARVYTLNDTDDFIAEYYINGEMMQFMFLRAADTLGEDIKVPDYIDSLDCDLWK